MAIRHQAVCLILWSALGAWASEFPAKYRGHAGQMTVDASAVSFGGLKWPLEDILELRLAPGKLSLVTYQRTYEFTGQIPADDLYRLLEPLLPQRLVRQAGVAAEAGRALWSAHVKHESRHTPSEGTLAFGEDAVVYQTGVAGESRTWRYEDIDNISTSGPFQLTVTTSEHARWHYAGRKDFNFVLKQPITESGYNQLWLELERKNGKLP